MSHLQKMSISRGILRIPLVYVGVAKIAVEDGLVFPRELWYSFYAVGMHHTTTDSLAPTTLDCWSTILACPSFGLTALSIPFPFTTRRIASIVAQVIGVEHFQSRARVSFFIVTPPRFYTHGLADYTHFDPLSYRQVGVTDILDIFGEESG